MSDNIPPDEVKRRLVIFLRIPAETWTDVLKLLPRRILVQNIAPACFRLKEISDKNVKNIHVIENAGQFCNNLEEDDPETNQQLEHLAGNDCQLASQFRLINSLWINSEKSQAILRNCPDLFNGCKVVLRFFDEKKSLSFFLECLGHLEAAKPISIRIFQRADQVINFWHHPTFQNCTRVHLSLGSSVSLSASAAATLTMTTTVVNIFDWLHHRQPTDEMDCAAAADQQVVRCMIAQLSRGHNHHIDQLLNRCSENLQQSRESTDRRPFVFSFECWGWEWTGFGQFRRIENKSSGEVLLLDRLMNPSGHPFYRLRRCLAEEEEANGPELYAGMFNDLDRGFGHEEFIGIDNEKTPEVIIG